jgi:DNA-binding winged helix-turn-helix (wHTH) protein
VIPPGRGTVVAHYTFGTFRLDVTRRVLGTDTGRAIPLPTRAFDTLVCLIGKAGLTVSKADLLRAVWPDVRVEENSVDQSISAIRRALGDTRESRRFIVTEPGRGYRFVAPVTAGRNQGLPRPGAARTAGSSELSALSCRCVGAPASR